jgi:hypothetical protein
VIFTGLPAVETAWERSALAIDKPKVYWSNLDKKNDQYDWKDKKSLHFCFRTKLFFFFFSFQLQNYTRNVGHFISYQLGYLKKNQLGY